MSTLTCHSEIMPWLRFEAETPRLQIWCSPNDLWITIIYFFLHKNSFTKFVRKNFESIAIHFYELTCHFGEKAVWSYKPYFCETALVFIVITFTFKLITRWYYILKYYIIVCSLKYSTFSPVSSKWQTVVHFSGPFT